MTQPSVDCRGGGGGADRPRQTADSAFQRRLSLPAAVAVSGILPTGATRERDGLVADPDTCVGTRRPLTPVSSRPAVTTCRKIWNSEVTVASSKGNKRLVLKISSEETSSLCDMVPGVCVDNVLSTS